MTKYIRIITVLLIFSVRSSNLARILAIFPAPSISHQIVFRPLTQELAKRGHEVVVITTDPAYPPGQAPSNLKEIDVHNESYETWQKTFIKSDIVKRKDVINQSRGIIKAFAAVFESQLQTRAIQNLIQNKDNKTFDLLIVENCVRPALAFYHIYKAPLILISSNGPVFGTYANLGVPSHPLLYPIVIHRRLYNLTYFEKVKELFNHYMSEYVYQSLEEEENKMLKKYFGEDIPTLSDLSTNIDMFFQNVHPVLMDNPPVPPSVVYIGGLLKHKVKPLPQDLEAYLNNSRNGVIYVSFGTNIKTADMSIERLQTMIAAFSKLPYDVLWKSDTDQLSGKSENIKILKWLPQVDLLKHPKIQAFVMHGGQQSTNEAINAGVPLIGIPMFGDQWFNVEKYVRHKIGVRLEWDTLTEEELRNAIITVIEDKSYRQNIDRISKIINDQPESPLDRAVWWIEHILRHGSKHLRAPAANMPWTDYYEIKLILILIVSLSVVMFAFTLLLYCIWLNVSTFYRNVKVKRL